MISVDGIFDIASARMIKNTVAYLSMLTTVQASLRARKVVECAMRTAKIPFTGLLWCARRALRYQVQATS